jgi:hypothetical protein
VAENVFDEKVDYLIKVRDAVTERDELRGQIDQMKQTVKKLGRSISAEEKSIQDEIATTVRKRKQELETGYDKHLEDNRDRRKSVVAKKEKKKNQKMNARMEKETKHIKEKNRDLETDLKSLFQKNKVPSFCRSKLYYIMFMPSGFVEIVKMLLGFVIVYAALPAVITILLRNFVLKGTENQLTLYSVIIPAVWIILFLILYFLIYIGTKVKHLEVIVEGRKIRDSIRANEKEAAAIRNSINKDKDESVYNLSSYDDKLKEIDAEADSINQEKKEALKTFEDETKPAIIEEINGRRLEKLNAMKQEKKNLEEQIGKAEEEHSEKSLAITNQYASYIGEEFCKKDKLEDLIALMEEGAADTVSEAIAAYKGQKSSK